MCWRERHGLYRNGQCSAHGRLRIGWIGHRKWKISFMKLNISENENSAQWEYEDNDSLCDPSYSP